jgi:Flp pilus assembly protein TadD
MEPLQTTADAGALSARVAALLDANRPAAARHLLAAVRRLVPLSPAVAELATRLAVSEGNLRQGLHELDQAVAEFPQHAGLRKWRADLRLRSDDTAGALADAAEAVILDRSDPVAKAILGVVLLEHGRASDARACLGEAVAAEPANPIFLRGLAAAQEASGDPDAALVTLTAAIAAAPSRAELHNAAIQICVRRQDLAEACRFGQEARRAGAADAGTFGLLGDALSSLDRHTEAGEAYAEMLKLRPDDPHVRDLVAKASERSACCAGTAP